MPFRCSLPSVEVWDAQREEFISIGGVELELEYSLYTISLWESKWKKPFVQTLEQMNHKEELELFKCMCLTEDVPESTWSCLNQKIRDDIFQYISDPMSATTITDHSKKSPKKKIITTEQIYSWMAQLGIPFECDRWHFNRLMKLIQVGMLANAPPKKMGKQEAAQLQREVFAANRAKYNSKG